MICGPSRNTFFLILHISVKCLLLLVTGAFLCSFLSKITDSASKWILFYTFFFFFTSVMNVYLQVLVGCAASSSFNPPSMFHVWVFLPNLLAGLRLKRLLRRLWASALRNCGIPNFALHTEKQAVQRNQRGNNALNVRIVCPNES